MDSRGPRRITPDSGPWPLHAAAAAKALEAEALAVHAPHVLMERAGLAVARLARALAPCARLVEVWCGPGNNGGDGYVAARWLHSTGTPVRLVECGSPERLPSDAAAARRAALQAGLVPMALQQALQADPSTSSAFDAPDLVIDGLLGLGTTRAPEGPLAEAIGAITRRAAPVLAIDLPSGLHPDTGQPLGAAVVRATHTLSLLTLKPGLFTGRGRDLAGTVWFDDLDAAAAAPSTAEAAAPGSAGADSSSSSKPSSPTAWLAGPAHRAPLPHAAHKGSRGDAWVVGGAAGMVGAAWLAARSALAAGAGRVFLSTLAPGEASTGAFDPARPELMHRPLAAATAQLADNATVIAGCGGSQAVRAVLPDLLARSPRLVLDADALNHVAAAPELVRLLRGRAARGQRTVLTPHPLEAARLLGTGSAAVQADRIAAATALAERAQCVVVLKGSGTVIAAPARLPHVNPSGNAMLATAGTGDVLAGWLGGLWAQSSEGDGFATACAAVWQHGQAADVVLAQDGGRGAPLLAADLIAALAASA